MRKAAFKELAAWIPTADLDRAKVLTDLAALEPHENVAGAAIDAIIQFVDRAEPSATLTKEWVEPLGRPAIPT